MNHGYIYRLETDGSFVFVDPPPIKQETQEFSLYLEKNIATFIFKSLGQPVSEEETRRKADDYCKSWELYAALQAGREGEELHFVFKGVFPPNEDRRLG